jgi:dihydropteroate synthase
MNRVYGQVKLGAMMLNRPDFFCGRFQLCCDHPLVMGIVNLTDDSFSGDGLADHAQAAIRHAWAQIEAGADILDVGAESTRPGALPVPADREMSRLQPVLRALRDAPVPLSVDTSKPSVMAFALDEGVSMINDVKALCAPGAIETVASADVALCLMHMRGEPTTMQDHPYYENVIDEVHSALRDRINTCVAAGIDRRRLTIDPGFGFGKTLDHNLALLRNLRAFSDLDVPVVVGLSRKSMFGQLLGRPVKDRLPASVAAALLAAQRGAAILRVHDVAATHDALSLWTALENGQ